MPAPGRPFKKGQTGNPKGSSQKQRNMAAIARLRPMLAEAAPHLTPDTLKLLIGGLLMGTVRDVKELQAEFGEDILVLYQTLANCISVCSKKGDTGGLLKLLEYVVGKAPERLEVTGRDGAPLSVKTESMSIEEMQQELAAIRARRRKQEKT